MNMGLRKKIMLITAGLLVSPIVQAQETTYLSNLGQSPTGSQPIGSDLSVAFDFTTGRNAFGANFSGYDLDSIQLAMGNATGDPGNFSVTLYAVTGQPGVPPVPPSFICSLAGPADPATAGVYNYLAPQYLFLPTSSTYCVLLTDSTPIADGAFALSESAARGMMFEWTSHEALFNVDFNNSQLFDFADPVGTNPQFAINATVVPEPFPATLLAFGGGILAFVRLLKIGGRLGQNDRV
jgi:hypothetical protein